jgi:hypothetical protein
MVFNLFGMTLANLLASVWPKVSCDFGFPLAVERTVKSGKVGKNAARRAKQGHGVSASVPVSGQELGGS